MNDATVALLKSGITLMHYQESGNSMTPIIKHRQPVTIAPIGDHEIRKGDVVIARVHGRLVCHLVTAIKHGQVQISNNHGHVNGWTAVDNVYGIVTHVDGVPRS